MENNASKISSEGKIQIKAKDEILEGKYANVIQIQHSKEEFVLDFMSIFPPIGNLNNRVILSPGHYKRMIRAVNENLQKYEEKYGKIEISNEPDTVNGFPVK
jgi:hypothetical protein